MDSTLVWIVIALPSIILASTVHEYAHALTAYKLGDATAKAEGRLSLNPLVHIDPIGVIAMIVARFGWSKPVPINEYNFQNPIIGTALTAAAGPFSNLIVAILTSLVFRAFSMDPNSIIGQITIVFIVVNLSLLIFNLIPIPPLDGHKIVRAFLPQNLRYYWEQLEKYSTWIILLVLLPITPISSYISIYIITVLNFGMKILTGYSFSA